MQQIKKIINTTLVRITSLIFSENSDFFESIKSGNHENIKSLLKTSRVNSFSKFGKTPLELACSILDVEMVNLLLNNGANPNIYKDKSPLVYTLSIVLNRYQIHGLTKDTQEYLQTQENKAFLIIKSLIEAKAEINYIDKEGRNILMTAAHRGNYEVVKLLIDLNADLQLNDKKGKSVFHYALMGENKNIVKLLCEIATSDELNKWQKEIPDLFTLTEIKEFINILQTYKQLDKDLVVSKEIKRVRKI